MRLILTSKGLNQKADRKIIGKAISGDDISDKRILLMTLSEYYIDEILKNACKEIGFKESNITVFDGEKHNEYSGIYHYIYVTEGNTFDIIKMLREHNMDTYIVDMLRKTDGTYIGASAGAMIAGVDFCLAEEFDKNRVDVDDYRGLDLFHRKVAVVPHYTKAEFERFKRNMNKECPGILDKYELYYISNYGIIDTLIDIHNFL